MSYVITTSICQVGSIAQFYVRETKLRDLCHTSWRRSPLALPGSCRVGDPQTRGQLYQRSSHTVVKVLGPQQISQLGDPAKELRTPREFDFEGQWDLITELLQNWGNGLLEGTTKPVSLRTQEKEWWPHKILSQTFLWVSWNPWRTCGLTVACHWVRGTGQNSLGISPLEGGCLYCHYRCHSLARPNYREGTQPHQSAENRIKDLLSMAPPIRTRPRFPHSLSLPSGSFHKALILIQQRADRMECPL